MNPLWFYRDNITGKREWNVMKEINLTYNHLDARDKVVLDVGGDFGLSPMHFIEHGARKVISYSLERQRSWLKHPDIEWHKEKWDYSTHEADVLKIDCEGCEYGKPLKWYLENFREMYFAIHDFPQFHDLFVQYKKVLDAYGELAYVAPLSGQELMYVLGGIR